MPRMRNVLLSEMFTGEAMSKIDTGPLSRENLSQQFCSTWLKDEIRTLMDERDEWERLAREWQSDYDKLKEKYAPTAISTGE